MAVDGAPHRSVRAVGALVVLTVGAYVFWWAYRAPAELALAAGQRLWSAFVLLPAALLWILSGRFGILSGGLGIPPVPFPYYIVLEAVAWTLFGLHTILVTDLFANRLSPPVERLPSTAWPLLGGLVLVAAGAYERELTMEGSPEALVARLAGYALGLYLLLEWTIRFQEALNAHWATRAAKAPPEALYGVRG